PWATNSYPAAPSRRLNSASLPALPDATTIRFIYASGVGRCGSAAQGFALDLDQPRDPLLCQRGHRVQLLAAEGMALRGALQLDETAAVVHHHVHVRVAVHVLGVVEVQHRHAAVDADRDRRHRAEDRRTAGAGLHLAAPHQHVHGIYQCDVGAGDRRGAGAAVGLDHVAIEGDRALAQGLAVHAGAQAAADQALDLQRAPALLATRGLAVAAGVRGTGEHAVLGGDPALAFPAQQAADAVLDTGGAQHLGVAEADQHRAFGMAGGVALDADRAQLVRGATTGTDEAVGNHC